MDAERPMTGGGAAPSGVVLGRDADYELVAEALASDGVRVVNLWGPVGAGKTHLLGQLGQEAHVAGRPCAIAWADVPGTDRRDVLEQLAVGLASRLNGFAALRLQTLLHRAMPTADDAAGLSGGMVGLAALLGGHGSAGGLKVVDLLVRTARRVGEERLRRRAEGWLEREDVLGPLWREQLSQTHPTELDRLHERALSADLADALGGARAMLLVDGVAAGSAVESSLRSLASALVADEASVVLVLASGRSLGWDSRTHPLSPGPKPWKHPDRVRQRRLEPFDDGLASQLLEQMGLTGEEAAELLALTAERSPGYLAAAGQALALAESGGPRDPDALRGSMGDLLLQGLMESIASAEREWLDAVCVPGVLTDELIARLYDAPDSDRITAHMKSRGVLRPVELKGLGQPTYRVEALLREAVRRQWQHGGLHSQRQRTVAVFFSEAVASGQRMSFSLAREALGALAPVLPAQAAVLARRLIDEQVASYRLGRGRSVAKSVEEIELAGAERAMLWMSVGRLEQAAASYAAARRCFEAAEHHAADDPVLRFNALKHQAECDRMAGDGRRARSSFERLALEALQLPDTPKLRRVAEGRAAWGLCMVTAQLDLLGEAFSHLERVEQDLKLEADEAAAEAAEQLGLVGWASARPHLQRQRAVLLRAAGDHVEAERTAQAAIDAYGDHSLVSRLYAQNTRAKALISCGLIQEASELVSRTAAAFERLGEPRARATTLVLEGDLVLLRRQWERARQLADRLRQARAVYPFAELYADLLEGEALRRSGDPRGALPVLDRVDQLAARLGSRVEAAAAHVAAADCLRLLHEYPAALDRARAAAAMADATGYLLVRCASDLLLADLDLPWRRERHQVQAQTRLKQATVLPGGALAFGSLLDGLGSDPLPLLSP